MAFGPRLEFRQSQALVMTPQLLQAIKLLQLSTVELSNYVEAELEKNPLLERVDDAPEGDIDFGPSTDDRGDSAIEARDDWAGEALATDRGALERDLDTDLTNAFPDEGPSEPRAASAAFEGPTLPSLDGSTRSAKGNAPMDGDENGLEALSSSGLSLREHLERQTLPLLATAGDRAIATTLIDAIDDAGYVAEPIEAIADRLGAEMADVEAVLHVIQAGDPVGAGARTLAECLALQLKDRDRFDPAMAVLISRLDLLAKRDFQQLKRLCRVDDADLADMVAEVRRLNPKPGLVFESEPTQSVTPDVLVRAAPDGGWIVEVNSDALPRVVANRSYYAKVVANAKEEGSRTFIDEAWANANWLTRSLEQRAKTILKVASEIVRQQDGFLAYGITQLRPLNLKVIADAVALHESTVSRVTSNKFMATPRGVFEMKYFFTAAIAGADGEAAHSAETVRFRIRQLIEQEKLDDILSDDAIVDTLREQGIEIARRTVAKYREAMRIPSSAARRREKRALTPA
jgi:RNA polymerase sigma-54 factor